MYVYESNQHTGASGGEVCRRRQVECKEHVSACLCECVTCECVCMNVVGVYVLV